MLTTKTSIPSPLNESLIVAERTAFTAKSVASFSFMFSLNCGSKTPNAISAPVPTAAYSSGNTETSYQIKVTVNGEEGFVDAISVDGEFQISPEGQLQLEALGTGGSGGGGC